MTKNINFVDIFYSIIQNEYSEKYYSRKYNERDYFVEILKVIYSNCYWSGYKGKFNYKTLYNKHLEYIKKDDHKKLYTNILKKYCDKNTY